MDKVKQNTLFSTLKILYLKKFIYSLLQQILTEHLLYVKHCFELRVLERKYNR